MDKATLIELARYQMWADGEHWKALQENPALRDDADIRKRLNHMVTACEMLQTLARGGTPDFAGMKERESLEELQAAMAKATDGLAEALDSVDFETIIQLPRGPRGPFQAPAGSLLLQALMHSQHHRGQNAGRMRELGVKPPMTDYIAWYAIGRP